MAKICKDESAITYNIMIYNDIERPQFTPDHLSTLKSDEVFVFGSNLQGMHRGGAARAALMHFGAIMGQGVGLQGQSYAIPTMQGGVETIKPYVDEFIQFANEHRELFFYVTRIGCGIAGFQAQEIAPLFQDAIMLDNVCLPKSFSDIIANSFNFTSGAKFAEYYDYSSFHMLVDICVDLNNVKHYSNLDDLKADIARIVAQEGRNGICRYIFSFIDYSLKTGCGGIPNSMSNLLLRLTNDKLSMEELSLHLGVKIFYCRRMVAKMLYVVKALTEMQSDFFIGMDFFYKFACICTGRWNCSDNDYMSDELDFQKNTMEHILEDDWDSLLNGRGELDSAKFYDKMLHGDFDAEKYCENHENIRLKEYLDRLRSLG